MIEIPFTKLQARKTISCSPGPPTCRGRRSPGSSPAASALAQPASGRTAGCLRTPRRRPSYAPFQLRRQRGRNLRQWHPLRRGLCASHDDPPQPDDVVISTAAGPKRLRLIERQAGPASPSKWIWANQTSKTSTPPATRRPRLRRDDPQCRQSAMRDFCGRLTLDWLAAAREAEAHQRFPNRSNVSFVRFIDRHTIDAVFSNGALEKPAVPELALPGPPSLLFSGMCVTVRLKSKHLLASSICGGRIASILTGPAEAIGQGRFFVEY